LAKAYRLTGDRKYADEIFQQWQHWHAENPYPIGINWASSLEVAFRSIPWIWMYRVLQASSVIPPDFHRDWLRAARWKQRGWQCVLEEARRQVNPNGLHFEQSTYYHMYALDFFARSRARVGQWAKHSQGIGRNSGKDDGCLVHAGRGGTTSRVRRRHWRQCSSLIVLRPGGSDGESCHGLGFKLSGRVQPHL
jgi:hypothetical protein